MSSNSTNLISSIKTRTASVLGSSYSELPYATDIGNNKSTAKKYGVIPLASSEISTNLRTITLDQQFELILTDTFINKSGDANEQLVSSTMQDLAFDVYTDLVTTKAGSPSTVLMVSNLQIDKPEKFQDNAVVIKARFIIKYRTNF